MFNFLQKKYIELHCYTNNKMVYDSFSIEKAGNFFPQWWKDLPKYPKIPALDPKLSMKGCFGFLELYKKSFILPLWDDLLITHHNTEKTNSLSYNSVEKIDKKIILKFSNHNLFTTGVDSHKNEQYFNMVDHNQWTLFKLSPPWMFECKENINFLVSDCFYNKKDLLGNIIISQGILNFWSARNYDTIGFVNKNIKETLLLAGSPLVFFTPLTERPVKVFCHLDPVKYDLLYTDEYFSFYNLRQRKIKQLLEKKIKQCPFVIK